MVIKQFLASSKLKTKAYLIKKAEEMQMKEDELIAKKFGT